MNEELRRILLEALRDVEYRTVILFGSRARGDFTLDSDYDILLVTRGQLTIREKMDLSASFRRRLARGGVDADVIVKSDAEVNYYRDKVGSLVKSAVEEGVAL